ncbi:hypothetical protein J4558_06170 [Leptolyngbya sp. 15MV]|nr:hypothetical protein J4558_06170 [Leptolyngbya sp. 15MV]
MAVYRSDLRTLTDRLVAELEVLLPSYHEDARLASFASLYKVSAFVADLDRLLHPNGNPRPVRLAEPLLRLAQAIASLTDGVADPLLERTSKQNGVPVVTIMGRAEAAGTMNACMMTGMGEREAAALVARTLSGSRLLADVRGDAATAIMNWRKHIAGTAETRPLYDLPSAPEWDAQAAGTYNVVAEMVDAFLRDGKRPEAIRSEPRRVCRRLFGLGQAARGRVPLAAWYCASASAGGT